ncbi:hypothetical protein HDU83_003767 [Entophlyctis luteolus]|nr:hypothetical protein HDU83_003767 [Entophlyctis luteolus]
MRVKHLLFIRRVFLLAFFLSAPIAAIWLIHRRFFHDEPSDLTYVKRNQNSNHRFARFAKHASDADQTPPTRQAAKLYTKPALIHPSFANYSAALTSIVGESLASNLSEFLQPPPLFAEWTQFAVDRGCLLGFKYYAQIYRDLLPYMVDDSGFLELEFSENPVYDGISFGRFAAREAGDRISSNQKPDRVFTEGWGEVLNPVAELMAFVPEFAFGFSHIYDEPQILPADDSTEQYKSPNDLFRHSKCFREKHDMASPENRLTENTNRYSHGFFMGPDSFITKNSKLPVFSQAKTECYLDLLIPMSYHMDILNEGIVEDKVSWNDKLNVLFWRGSSTSGKYISGNPWHKFHRTRLLEWADEFEQRYPNNVFDAGKSGPPNLTDDGKSLSWLAVDIGLHKLVQAHGDVPQQMEQRYPFHSYVGFQETLQFKYLLIVDGNTWPSRTPRYLASNSVILLATAFTDWFMWMLQPFVHYIPVKLDFSDLEDRMRWLHENDEKARQISNNAQKLMEKINRLEQMQCYSGLMMTATPVGAKKGFSVSEKEYRELVSKAISRPVPDSFLPPPFFDRWTAFAKEKNCLPGLENYAQIYTDLSPYMADNSVFRRVNDADAFFDSFDSDQKYSVEHALVRHTIFNSIEFVIAPLRAFEFAVNAYDLPQTIPGENSPQLYFAPDDVYKYNQCARTQRNSLKNVLQLNKTRFEVTPQGPFLPKPCKRPLFSQAKTECYLDLLIPMARHIEASQTNYVDEVKWSDKNPSLFWRESVVTGGCVHQ